MRLYLVQAVLETELEEEAAEEWAEELLTETRENHLLQSEGIQLVAVMELPQGQFIIADENRGLVGD